MFIDKKSNIDKEGNIEINLHNINNISTNSILKPEELLSLYKDMLIIRFMEQYLDKEYKNGNIRGFCHLGIGEEALYAVLKRIINNDCLICSYRCHGAAYAAGLSLQEIICENLGLKEGNSKGKGGSMHLYGNRFFGGHGIVGSQVPLGAGLAFALKYKSRNKQDIKTDIKNEKAYFINIVTDEVCFCIFGDGASNQGQVYETYNMAKIYRLPIVFIIENNQYGMSTPITDVSVDDCLFKRGYEIPGIRLRDTKIDQLNGVLEGAKKYAKSKGPIIVQVDTFRKCGHSTLDEPGSYMSRETVEREEKLDCLLNLENKLKESRLEEEMKEVQGEACQIISDVVSRIDFKNVPDLKELFTDLHI